MKQLQRITLKETHETFLVDAMEYPYQMAGILYLKLIVYNEDHYRVKMLTIQPGDVLKRENDWTQKEEDEMVAAADAADEQNRATAEVYQAAAEAELKRRAEANVPVAEEGGDPDGLFG